MNFKRNVLILSIIMCTIFFAYNYKNEMFPSTQRDSKSDQQVDNEQTVVLQHDKKGHETMASEQQLEKHAKKYYGSVEYFAKHKRRSIAQYTKKFKKINLQDYSSMALPTKSIQQGGGKYNLLTEVFAIPEQLYRDELGTKLLLKNRHVFFLANQDTSLESNKVKRTAIKYLSKDHQAYTVGMINDVIWIKLKQQDNISYLLDKYHLHLVQRYPKINYISVSVLPKSLADSYYIKLTNITKELLTEAVVEDAFLEILNDASVPL